MKNVLFILAAFIGSITFAQDELTVIGAIEKALTNNYEIKLIEGNYNVSKLQNSWGQAGMLPTFSLNVNNSAILQDNTNNPATFFPGVLFNDNLQASLDMSWTIFSGFGIRINKERFDKIQEQTKGNAVVIIESTIYDIIMAYYAAVVQTKKLELMSDMLVYSKEKLAYFEMKNEMGLSTSLDLLEFKNQVLADSTNYLLQELSVNNSQRNLNLIMAEDVEVTYVLTDPLTFETPASSYTEMKQEMLANNSNLKNQFMNYELKELEVQSKSSAFYPIITLNLGTTPSVGYFELLDSSPAFSSNTSSWSHSAVISMRYDIFRGWTRKRNVQIAEIQRDLAGIQIEQLQMQMTHQLRANFDLYKTRNKVENMALKRVDHASQLWSLGKEKYNLGLINVFNLNDIRTAYQLAVLSSYDRLFELLQTHYDLMRLTGNIAQQYKIEENFGK